MATALAEKIEFEAQAAPVPVTSRRDAIALTRAGQDAVHEHMTDARVYSAASALIEGHRRGRSVDIEAYGYPFDVLQNVAHQLQAAGATHTVAEQILGALEDYIVNLGSDFSREAQAKPLYARIAVVNQAPDDLPECEQTQATMIDGVRKIGGEAARVNVQSTLYGTKSTTSHGVDLGTLFASKTDGLFVFFGAPSNEAVKGFDSVDNALVNLMQGMGGGGISAAVMEEIKDAIKNGEATPEMLKLIDTLATLQQVSEAALTPGALENPAAQIADIVADISAQLQSGMEGGVVPPALVDGALAVLTDMAQTSTLDAIITRDIIQQITGDNDNSTLNEQVAALSETLGELVELDTLDADTRAVIEQAIDALEHADGDAAVLHATLTEISTIVAALPAAQGVSTQVSVIEAQMGEVAQTIAPDLPLLDRLPMLAELGAADLLQVIEALQQADALPEALADIIERMDGQPPSVEQLVEALQGQGELAGDVQAIILALSDPEVQQALPQETLNAVNEFAAKQPDLIEAVATVAVVQQLESALATLDLASPDAAQIEEIVTALQDGTQTIRTMDGEALAPVINRLEGTPAARVIEQATQIAQNVQTPPAILSADTTAALALAMQDATLSMAQQQQIQDALESGDPVVIAETLRDHPQIIEALPPAQAALVEQALDVSAPDFVPPTLTDPLAAPVMPVDESMTASSSPEQTAAQTPEKVPEHALEAHAPDASVLDVQGPAGLDAADPTLHGPAPLEAEPVISTTGPDMIVDTSAPHTPETGRAPDPVITPGADASPLIESTPVAPSVVPVGTTTSVSPTTQTGAASRPVQYTQDQPRTAAGTPTSPNNYVPPVTNRSDGSPSQPADKNPPAVSPTSPSDKNQVPVNKGPDAAPVMPATGQKPAADPKPSQPSGEKITVIARNDNTPGPEGRGPGAPDKIVVPTALKGFKQEDIVDIATDFSGCAGGCGPCTACGTDADQNAGAAPAAQRDGTSFIIPTVEPASGTITSASPVAPVTPAVVTTITGLSDSDMGEINTEFNDCAGGCGPCTACAPEAAVERSDRAGTPARHIG